MTEVPEDLSKKLEAHMDDPSKIIAIFCEKYDNKGNNKLPNLCKELECCALKNIQVEPDYWFTDFSHLNKKIENISIDFKKIEKVGNSYHW